MLKAQYTITPEYKLRKHCKAIRENQVAVAVMILAMEGYPVDLTKRGKPMPGFARECLDELGYDTLIAKNGQEGVEMYQKNIDNIDIVINELDALVNIDLATRTIKPTHTALNIVRVGTSGSLQNDIPVDSFLMSTFGLDLNGMMLSYQVDEISHPEIENAFVKHTNWSAKKCHPIIIENRKELEAKIFSEKIFKGMTATAGGFYGP